MLCKLNRERNLIKHCRDLHPHLLPTNIIYLVVVSTCIFFIYKLDYSQIVYSFNLFICIMICRTLNSTMYIYTTILIYSLLLLDITNVKKCLHLHPLQIIFHVGNVEASHKLCKNYIFRQYVGCVFWVRKRLFGMTMFVQWRY